MGVANLRDKGSVKSIEIIKEGDRKGHALVVLSDGVLGSQSYYCHLRNILGSGKADIGDSNLDFNIIDLVEAENASTGEVSN